LGSVETSSSSSQSASPAVRATVDKLATGVGNAYTAGPKVFNQSLYAGVGPTTQSAWANTLNAANNPAYASNISDTMASFGNIARGDYVQNGNPYAEQLLQKSNNDISSAVNAGLGSSGRLGSNLQIQGLSEAIGNNSNAFRSQQYETERDRQVQAAGLLPGLYQAGLQPSAIQGQVGAAQDADAQAALQGQADLFSRNANADTDLLAKLSSILAGNASAAGTNQTTQVPWWQAGLAGITGIGGLL